MGKVVGSILSVITSPLSLIDKDLGNFVSGAVLTAIGFVTGNPALIALGLGRLSAAFQSSPRPDAAETAIKTARPPRVSAYGASRLYGAYLLYETATDGAGVDVFAVHDGELTSVLQLYLNDDEVILTGDVVNEGDDGRYADDKISMHYTDGASPGTAISAVVTKLPGIWSSDHRGDGIVQLAVIGEAVKAKHFLDVYPNGFPLGSMAAQWQKCPDPDAIDPTDESAWTWTENSIRHLMHYMIVREGVDYASKIAPTLSYWQAAAAICEEAITLKGGGSEERYRSCVSHKHTDAHGSVKAAIMQTCDGWMAPRADGAIIVYAGKYYAPTVSIGASEIVAFEWSGVGVDDSDAINELICGYVSADHQYNSVETDAWRDEDDISERGQVLAETLDIQCPSWGQVRRLAKRAMARQNALYRGTVTTNFAGRSVLGERFINLAIEEAGVTFYDGPAEIVACTRNISSGGVTFEWIAADENIDAWNPATEEGDPAPVGNRVAAVPIDTPVIDTATAQLSADGTFAQISVVITSEDRSDLTWFLRWKISTNTIWNEAEYTDIDAGTSVELLSDTVPINAMVDVAVAYQVGDGRVSDWSATATVDTTTANLAPSGNTSFTAVGGVGNTSGSWSNSLSSNFGHSELWSGPTTDFDDATQLGSDYTGTQGVTEAFSETLSAGTYYLWTVAFNAANTASSRTGPIEVTVT